MLKSNKLIIFKLFYFCMIGGIGAFAPYINIYLESKGLSGSQIGQVTSIGLVLTVLIMPLWGMIADKTKRHKLLILVSLGLTLLALYVYSRQTVYIGILLSSIFLNIARCGAMPMADTQAMNYCQETHGNYGSIRGMGSLGYMLVSMTVGFAADKVGLDGPLFGIYATLVCASIFLALNFPKTQIKEEEEKKERFSMQAVKQLITNKNFLFILLTLSLTTALIDSAHMYSGNHLLYTLNAPVNIMSWMTLITVLPEVAFLMVANKFFDRWGYKKFYQIMSFTVFLRLLIYAIAPSPYLFLAISIVHCIHVACETVGYLTYVKYSVSPAVFATAITIMNAFVSISQAVYGYIFGIVYEKLGSSYIFSIGAILCGIGFILISRTHCFDHMNTINDKDVG